MPSSVLLYPLLSGYSSVILLFCYAHDIIIMEDRKTVTLYLAGGGISAETITLGLKSLIKDADKIYVETYTIPGSEWLYEFIKNLAPQKTILAHRSDLEDSINQIIEEARSMTILIVAPGDPLIATTHRSIILEADKNNVEYRILPGVSGVCAAKTITGLDYYKFGRTITIPGPWRGVKPYSTYYYLVSNLCIGLHTLLLLDIDDKGRQLSPCLALKQLNDVEIELSREAGYKPILDKLLYLAVSRAGLVDSQVIGGKGIEKICNNELKAPISIIVPGRLSSYEKEYLETIYRIQVEELSNIQERDYCKIMNLVTEII